MNVAAMFDGMSCGQMAFDRLGIKFDSVKNKYFASEIEKNAIKVTQANYQNTIQLGDITKWREWDLPEIDFLIGGSPCQGFSTIGNQLNIKDERSRLFFEFSDMVKTLKHKYFMLENVKMKKEYQDIISRYLGVEPIFLNSSDFSAQNRPRLYWTNIPDVKQPLIKNKSCVYDILEECAEFNTNYAKWMFGKWGKTTRFDKFSNASGKARCLTASMAKGKEPTYCVNDDKEIHKYSPIECERLQTVPDDYTKGVSNTRRYEMLGNGWTVDVIAHILKNAVQEYLVEGLD